MPLGYRRNRKGRLDKLRDEGRRRVREAETRRVPNDPLTPPPPPNKETPNADQ
jgi:hypothetical protein